MQGMNGRNMQSPAPRPELLSGPCRSCQRTRTKKQPHRGSTRRHDNNAVQENDNDENANMQQCLQRQPSTTWEKSALNSAPAVLTPVWSSVGRHKTSEDGRLSGIQWEEAASFHPWRRCQSDGSTAWLAWKCLHQRHCSRGFYCSQWLPESQA